MYRIYLTNHGYFVTDSFDTLSDAIKWAKQHSFQVSVHESGEIAASWCPINGTQVFARDRSTR